MRYNSPTLFSMSKRLIRRQVLAIREQYDAGFGIQEIADRHRVSRTTVSRVVHMKSHQPVKDIHYTPFPRTEEQQARVRENIVNETRRRRRLAAS